MGRLEAERGEPLIPMAARSKVVANRRRVSAPSRPTLADAAKPSCPRKGFPGFGARRLLWREQEKRGGVRPGCGAESEDSLALGTLRIVPEAGRYHKVDWREFVQI